MKTLSDAARAAEITRAASKQTYYTIRFLVDPPLVEDAYRAYAYFRWVDDWLDQEQRPRRERLAFIERQRRLVEACYGEGVPDGLAPEERFLADLIGHDSAETGCPTHPVASSGYPPCAYRSGLQAYICNMMAVMAFDAERRGRMISQRELDEYTHWLAVGVTENMHHFIGHRCGSPQGTIRYLAVAGAHIAHMLRDALEDCAAGYYNIPREVIEANHIQPGEVESRAYRRWVQGRVKKARACFQAGRDYLAQVECLRCRVAGYAYIHRFEVVLDSIEREGYLLRSEYPERKGRGRGLEMIGWALWMGLRKPHAGQVSPAYPVH